MIKKKKIVQIVIFVFLATFLFVNCERDPILVEEKGLKIKRISLKELSKNTNIMQSIHRYKERTSTKSFSKTVLDSITGIEIDTDIVIYIENNTYHSYTFSVTNTVLGAGIQNIILSLQQDGTYKEYLGTYAVTDDEKELMEMGIYVNTEGKFSITPLENSNFSDEALKMVITGDDGCTYDVTYVDFLCESGEHSFGDYAYCIYEGTAGAAYRTETRSLIECFGSASSSPSDPNVGGDYDDGSTPTSTNENTVNVGSGNTTNTTNTNPLITGLNLPTLTLDTPCDNLLDILKPASIKAKINILRTHSADQTTTGEDEKGFRIRKNSNDNAFTPSAIKTGSDNGEEKNVNIVPTPYTIAVVHTHPPNGVAFFSAKDVLYLARMANSIATPGSTNNIDPLNLTMFLIVDSQTFAIRFDDLDAIQILKDIYSDMEERDRFKVKLDYKYGLDTDFRTGERSGITQQQRHLLTFLDDYNLNVSIYEATYLSNEIDSWEKFNNDGSTEPCN